MRRETGKPDLLILGARRLQREGKKQEAQLSLTMDLPLTSQPATGCKGFIQPLRQAVGRPPPGRQAGTCLHSLQTRLSSSSGFSLPLFPMASAIFKTFYSSPARQCDSVLFSEAGRRQRHCSVLRLAVLQNTSKSL